MRNVLHTFLLFLSTDPQYSFELFLYFSNSSCKKKCYLKITFESFIFKLFLCKIMFHLGKLKGFTCIDSECVPDILVKIRFGNFVSIMNLLNRSVYFYGTLFPVVVFFSKKTFTSVENASHVI